jgi:ABC-type iron transport system FetAB ATPase subunit
VQVKTTNPSEVIELLKAKGDSYNIFTRYNFLLKHNGIRPECSHGLIGPMGCGKSTLAKKIAEDCATKHKVLVWLTEENSEQWEAKITNNKQNIRFFEEKSLSEDAFKDTDRFYFYLRSIIDSEKPDILIIDNLTTSYAYSDDIGPKGQAKSARMLMKLMKELKFTLFYVAHTKKEVTSNFHRALSAEDIRGSAQITIQTEYLYLFHKYSTDQKPYSIIRTVKHRYHDDAGGLHLLHWRDGHYSSDLEIEWSKLKEFFKQRDTLC